VSDDITRQVEDMVNHAIDSAELAAVADAAELARTRANEHRKRAAAALAAGCEVCGKPAGTVVTRRIHTDIGGGCQTQYDPSAPMHARCGEHASCDAYVIDGVAPSCGRKHHNGSLS